VGGAFGGVGWASLLEDTWPLSVLSARFARADGSLQPYRTPKTATNPFHPLATNPRGRTFSASAVTTGAYKSCTTTDALRPLCSNGGSVCGLTSQLGAQCVAGLLNQMITNACGPGTCFSGVGTVMTNGNSSLTVPATLSACCGPTARPSDANLQACVNSVNAWNQARGPVWGGGRCQACRRIR
jgi:hypothetical protein